MANPSAISCGLAPPPVPMALLLEHARAAVSAVVSAVWPGEPVVLGPHLPSVTNYVTALEVNGAGYIAKYSVLGTSLVSVVRGVHGDWATAEAAQRDYVRDPHSQLARERAQLRLLAAHARRTGPELRVPPVIAHQDGVLITAAATAPSLGTELLRGPRAAAELLAGVATVADRLHKDRVLAAAVTPALLARPHTSIAGTYARKFLSPASDRYLTTLGAGWADNATRRRLQHALAALRPTLAPLRYPDRRPAGPRSRPCLGHRPGRRPRARHRGAPVTLTRPVRPHTVGVIGAGRVGRAVTAAVVNAPARRIGPARRTSCPPHRPCWCPPGMP